MTKLLAACVVVLALAMVQVTASSYNPSLGKLYMEYSKLAYCDGSVLQKMSCDLCKEMQDETEFLHYYSDGDIGDTVAYSIFYDQDKDQVINSFRGTDNHWQLFIEGVEGSDTDYELYDIEDAMVTRYFYQKYTQNLRSDFISQMQQNLASYPDSTFVFTGHSLGAALTTHAVLDVLMQNMLPSSQVLMYNYGCPRVGNYAFAQAVEQTVPVRFRVVHWADIVPHVPLCKEGPDTECITDQDASSYTEAGLTLWPAYHYGPQIFYNEAQTSYQECSAEQPSCANQFGITQFSVADHLDYFNIQNNC